MRQRFIFEGSTGHQYSLVKKIVVTSLLLTVLSMVTIPFDVFAAQNKKIELSIELHSPFKDYLSIDDVNQAGLDITGDMTISLWVKPTTLSGNMALVSKWNHVLKTSYLLFIENGNLGVHLSAIGSGFGYGTFYAPYTKSANEWANVTLVYTSASGTVEFYVNGLSVGKSADFALPTSIANTDAQFMIGSREGNDTNFDGLIDDVHIWSRAFSNSETLQLYSHPKKFNNELQLQGHWKFNGNYNDDSGNSNNLLSNQGMLFSNEVPF